MGVSYFLYRVLDELDGKQARKTGNASPLGLLFDHGFDALSMGLLTMVYLKCAQTGDNELTVLTSMVCGFMFHMATLEEYYIGELTIGPGNAVTDASLPYIILCFYMAACGNDFWTDSIIIMGKSFKGSFLFLIGTLAACAGNFVVTLYKIFAHHFRKS